MYIDIARDMYIYTHIYIYIYVHISQLVSLSQAEFVEYGISFLTELCKKLVDSKLVPGLHFYSLNQAERTFQIMTRLGYYMPA